MQIAPAEAVMVGDNLESDIRPAADLGMKTIWLNHNNAKINAKITPDIEISCISELLLHI